VIQQVHSKLRYGMTVFSYHLHPGTNYQIHFATLLRGEITTVATNEIF